MSDRLTEIKARDEVDAPYLSLDTIEGEALRDRRVLLAEIQRLEREDENAKHDIERLMDSLNKTEAERERLEAELARLTSPEPPDSR